LIDWTEETTTDEEEEIPTEPIPFPSMTPEDTTPEDKVNPPSGDDMVSLIFIIAALLASAVLFVYAIKRSSITKSK
jgi:hypothetical protein